MKVKFVDSKQWVWHECGGHKNLRNLVYCLIENLNDTFSRHSPEAESQNEQSKDQLAVRNTREKISKAQELLKSFLVKTAIELNDISYSDLVFEPEMEGEASQALAEDLIAYFTLLNEMELPNKKIMIEGIGDFRKKFPEPEFELQINKTEPESKPQINLQEFKNSFQEFFYNLCMVLHLLRLYVFIYEEQVQAMNEASSQSTSQSTPLTVNR